MNRTIKGNKKKLQLNAETLRTLTNNDLQRVNGGRSVDGGVCSETCVTCPGKKTCPCGDI